jgi:hypothetical protein
MLTSSDRFRRFALLLSLLLAASSLAGCASTGPSMGDVIPQWAGGLPADAPPRPGTPKYDAYMQERERRRQMPAAERDKLPPVGSEAAPAAQ